MYVNTNVMGKPFTFPLCLSILFLGAGNLIAQCEVNTNAAGQTTFNSLIGQSITMPTSPCIDGGFTALRVVQTSNNSDIVVELYDQQGQLQYRQTDVALTVINSATNLYRIRLQGGQGSLAFEGGQRYTFYFSSAGPLQFGRSNTGLSTYSGGHLYENGPVVADLYLTVETTQAIPAPVAWSGFNARLDRGGVLLDWSTAQEWDNAGFTVERSADGSNWQSLGQVAAGERPAGPQEYTYHDPAPPAGQNYYRIRQTDFDGTIDYSEIRSVWVEAGSAVRLYPNPARAGSRIVLTFPAEQICLVDLAGRRIPLAVAQGQVDLPSVLPAGLYMVQAAGRAPLRLIVE